VELESSLLRLWLPGKDSNLRSRIQSPLPYHLATGQDLNNTSAGRVTRRRVPALGLAMKIGWLAALLLATAGCGAYQFPSSAPSPTPSTGTVSGRVIAVPCAPVEQPGNTCAGRAVPNLEIDYVVGTVVEARAVTGADGTYAVALRPGAYTVRMKTYMRVISGPLKLTLAAGSTTVANYVLDSGIRVPVPQQ
jgi:hypothetical protein